MVYRIVWCVVYVCIFYMDMCQCIWRWEFHFQKPVRERFLIVPFCNIVEKRALNNVRVFLPVHFAAGLTIRIPTIWNLSGEPEWKTLLYSIMSCSWSCACFQNLFWPSFSYARSLRLAFAKFTFAIPIGTQSETTTNPFTILFDSSGDYLLPSLFASIPPSPVKWLW